MTRQEILAVAKPTLFNADMIRAILDGRKTATRRVIKPQPQQKNQFFRGFCISSTDKKEIGCASFSESEMGGFNLDYIKPPYRPDDYLYVRETWAVWSPTYGIAPKLYYKADNGTPTGIKWHPSIHMPKEAARIFLRVTAVRAERLQEMALADVLMEGIQEANLYEETWNRWHNTWDSTIKPADLPLYGWDANPWVWVIEFERIEVDSNG